MADFNVTLTDLQKVLATVSLTKSNGDALAVTGLTATLISGDASVSNLDNQGNPLPVNLMYFVSGNTDGTSVFALSIDDEAGGNRVANVIMEVVAGEITVNITFGAPEPK